MLVEEGFVSAGNKLEYLEQLAAFPLLNQVSSSVAEPEPVGAGTFLVGARAGAGVKM